MKVDVPIDVVTLKNKEIITYVEEQRKSGLRGMLEY